MAEVLCLVVLFFFGWGLSDFLSTVGRAIFGYDYTNVTVAIVQLVLALALVFSILHYVDVVPR